MEAVNNHYDAGLDQPQGVTGDPNETCKEIIFVIEKISGLCRFLEIDPSIYIQKGKIPSQEQCAVLLEAIYQSGIENQDLKQRASELVNVLERLLSSLPLQGDYTQAYEEIYREIKQNQPLFHVDFVTSFFTHTFFQLFAASSVSRAMIPFFTTRINEHTDELLHFNSNRAEEILNQEAFMECEGRHLSPLDQLIYGVFMMALLQSSQLIFNSTGMNVALPAIFSTPQIMEEVVSSPFFQQFKSYILEAAPQFFEEGLKTKVYERELSKILQKGGINTLNALINNPGQEIESVIGIGQKFISHSFQDTFQGAKKVGEASLSFFRKSAKNLGYMFSLGAADTANRQLEIGKELAQEITQQTKKTEASIDENYKVAQGNTSQLFSHYKLLISSYSPEWELYKNILPNAFLFLALANSNSTNSELLVRALMTGATILSGKGKTLPIAGVVFLSSLMQKYGNKFGKNKSIMNGINAELSIYGREVRNFLEGQKTQLNNVFQENLGLTPDQSKKMITVFKEMLFASPMLLLAFLSGESYAFSWLMFYNPLENIVSYQAKKWGNTDDSELNGDSSIYSIANNTILYNLMVGTLLLMAPSTFYANVGACFSQMPSLKDPATQWINEKTAPLIRKGVQVYAPEWIQRYDQAVQAYSTYAWTTELLGKATDYIPRIPTIITPYEWKNQLIEKGKGQLRAVVAQIGLSAVNIVGASYLRKGGEVVASYTPEFVSSNAKVANSLFYDVLLASMLYYSIPSIPKVSEFPLIENSLKGTVSTALAVSPSQSSDPVERKNTLLYLAGALFALHFVASALSFSDEPTISGDPSSSQLGFTSFMMIHFLSIFSMRAISFLSN